MLLCIPAMTKYMYTRVNTTNIPCNSEQCLLHIRYVLHGFMSSNIKLYLTDHDREHLFAQENHNNDCPFQTGGTADSTCIERKTILSEGVDHESMFKI